MNSSEVIFLLRGMTRESRHWEGFDLKLQECLSNIKVVCLDLPGFGENNHVTSPSTIEEITDFLFKSEEYKQYQSYKKHILSLSLGGMVTLEMIHKRHEEFDKVIIINSSQKFKTPFYKRLNLQFAPTLGISFLLQDISFREKLIYKYTVNSKLDEVVINKWVELFEDKPFSLKSAMLQLQAASAFNLEGKVKGIQSTKGLVLISKKDRLVNPETSETIAGLLKWPIEYHPTAGHDMTFDASDWVMKAVKKHLKA